MNNLDSIGPGPDQKPTRTNVNTGSGSPARPNNTVSLLSKQQKSSPPRVFKKILKLMGLIIVVLAIFVVARAANLSNKIFVGQKTTFFGKVWDFFGGSDQQLKGEELGQINVLLLGIGGEGHDGPYLSDTMILAQIRPDTGQVTLTSIPRDYYVKLPNGGEGKINEAFSYGYLKNHDYNQGGQWAEQVVENMSGLKVPYFAVMDFSGFEKAVDQVGGVDISVDKTFTDSSYPDSGYGYLPPITFTKGPAHLDGVRALQFARSRHGTNDEGSDYARSLRQQKIIEAFKQEVFSQNLISDAGKINKLVGTFADHFHTNMSPTELYHIYSLSKDKNINQFLSLSLDPDTGLVCQEILASTGAFIITPCADKSEQDIADYFKNSFAVGKLNQEKARVWLANSTGDRQKYETAFRKLTNAGLMVYQLGYTKDDLSSTVVYEVNPKPASTEFIKNTLFGTLATQPPPGVHISTSSVDVIVVLGANAPSEATPKLYIPPPARIPTTSTTTLTSIATSTPTATSTKPK